MSNQLNLQRIDQEQALNLTKFFIQSQQNLFLFGRRGTGKSEIVLQAAKECDIKVNYINLSVIERPDLAGYPNIHEAGDIVTFKSPAFLPHLIDDRPDTIVLFDEVDKAPPEVTAPLLEILQFRKINNKKLNISSCILTGNMSNEGAYSNTISSALLDRGAKYILSFNFDKWIDWAKANGVHDLILGFLRSNPEFACGEDNDVSYASPSPRSWTLASIALCKAKDLKISEIETVTQIISGFVGNDVGIRFKIWYEHYRRFEPFIHNLITSGELTINYKELTPTEKIVFVVSACYFAKQKVISGLKTSKNKFLPLENLCKFFIDSDVAHEIQVMGLYNSFDFNFITKYKLYTCNVFFELFKKYDVKIKG